MGMKNHQNENLWTSPFEDTSQCAPNCPNLVGFSARVSLALQMGLSKDYRFDEFAYPFTQIKQYFVASHFKYDFENFNS